MCLACEEAQLYYCWRLLQQVARGQMPEGLSEDDLRALDLPLPGEIAIVERSDGTRVIERIAAPGAGGVAAAAKAKPGAFVCDSPDGE